MKNLIDLKDKNFFDSSSSIEKSKDYYDEDGIVELLSEVEINSEEIKMDLMDDKEKVVSINFKNK